MRLPCICCSDIYKYKSIQIHAIVYGDVRVDNGP